MILLFIKILELRLASATFHISLQAQLLIWTFLTFTVTWAIRPRLAESIVLIWIVNSRETRLESVTSIEIDLPASDLYSLDSKLSCKKWIYLWPHESISDLLIHLWPLNKSRRLWPLNQSRIIGWKVSWCWLAQLPTESIVRLVARSSAVWIDSFMVDSDSCVVTCSLQSLVGIVYFLLSL